MSLSQIWEAVKGFEGLYEVSNDGFVKGLKSGTILKPSYTYNGYPRVKLYKTIDGKRTIKSILVHRLVASAYIPNPENKSQVNHLDGIKTNNNIENLEWCTPSENLIHSVKTGLRDMSCCTKATMKKVNQYSLDGVYIKTWESMSEAARSLDLQIANISHCCAGRIRQTGGYKWNFVR